MRLPPHLRRLRGPRNTALFSDSCISSASVWLQNFYLHSARCAILTAYLLRQTPLLSQRVRPPSFTEWQSCSRSIRLNFVRLLRRARRWHLPYPRGCCSNPVLASSATINPAIPRLVGALSFSFEEAVRVESLCNGMLAAQSSGFWLLLALLHWLKELGFEAPDLNLGWGATVADQFASGVWLESEVSLSINHSKLLAVERGLRTLCPCLEGRVVAVFCDNTTAVAYMRRQGRTLSPTLNAVAQCILRWAEQLNIILMPQFVPGTNNVVADALSRPNQVLSLEWMLHQDVFSWLRQCWLVTINLFASSLSHRCSVYFAPVSDPMAAGTDAMLQSWDSLQAYAFPPFAMISQVLAKVRAS